MERETMKFAIATVAFWEALGYDTANWRKSNDGNQAITELKYAEILGVNLRENPEVKIYFGDNPELIRLLESAEWHRDGTNGPFDSYNLLEQLAEVDTRLTTAVAEVIDGEAERVAAEDAREVTYNALVADVQANVDAFDVALEDGIVAENLAVKLAEKEATYAPRLTAAEQQLADKVGGGVKAEPEDLSATTLGLVTGTGGPINLLSIPQDKSATWAKRTETGSFAKIMLTGDIPNFNTSTGILTFPSDIRILVGLSYYSVPAQTVDFSALLKTSSQIFILFNVTTLAFQVVSPAYLSSASHEQSVLVASIMNVTGRRKTPEMNCQFSVNNVPYIPDIERMLLSKAIPQTEQVVQYHDSGVINNIQHKDSNGNTIRTDTFTFSAGTVVEERRHNLTNTKITFTTTLSTLTTEVI